MRREGPLRSRKAEEAERRRVEEERRKGRRAALGFMVGGGALIGLAKLNFNAIRPSDQAFEGHEGERHQPSERFTHARDMYGDVYARFTKEQVVFFDQYGEPIGGPREALLERDPENPRRLRISQRWLDAERAQICRDSRIYCDQERDLPRQTNVISQLQGEAEGTTYLDMVERNGRRTVLPLPGVEGVQKGEGLSRIRYVHRYVRDSMTIPETAVQEEIARLAPALIGVESTYENDVTSDADATNAAQITEIARTDLGYTAAQLKYFRTQVEAMGKLFSRHYAEIVRLEGPFLSEIQNEYFGSDAAGRDRFLREFMAPLVINSYNAGQGRMVRVLRWFKSQYPNRAAFERVHGAYEGSPGRDLVHVLMQEAFIRKAESGYGRRASIYWIEIEGLAAEMETRGLY